MSRRTRSIPRDRGASGAESSDDEQPPRHNSAGQASASGCVKCPRRRRPRSAHPFAEKINWYAVCADERKGFVIEASAFRCSPPASNPNPPPPLPLPTCMCWHCLCKRRLPSPSPLPLLSRYEYEERGVRHRRRRRRRRLRSECAGGGGGCCACARAADGGSVTLYNNCNGHHDAGAGTTDQASDGGYHIVVKR